MRSVLQKIFLFLIFFQVQCSFCQTKPAAGNTNGFKLFFEKVYLHTDKQYYLSGDNIWFKAYLVNPRSNQPTFTSNNLYVDLINADGDLMDQEMIRLDQGVGHGDFKLSDSLPSGTYQLRAYSNWMKNFGNEFVFEKMIQIRNGRMMQKVLQGKDASQSRTSDSNKMTSRIQFFPEGGSLIQSVPTRIACKAETASGKSIIVSGSVWNAKGEQVASFKTDHTGMGSFIFLPQPNEHYEIKTIHANLNSIPSVMPSIHETGLALSVQQTDSIGWKAIIKTNSSGLALYSGKYMRIQAKQSGRLMFEDSVLLDGLSKEIYIPAAHFLPGVVMITLLDHQARPHCERLVYTEKHSSAHITVQSEKPVYSFGEDPSVRIQFSNDGRDADSANLSLAVVDAALLTKENENLISYLLLESEIKGRIDYPAQYVDPNNPDRLQQLDLLLMTQGWREFLWTRLAANKISIHHLPESGITISGNLKKPLVAKPMANMNITLFAPQAVGDKIYFTRTDTAGKFYLDGLNLLGTQRIKLVSKDDKGKKAGVISIDPIQSEALPGFSFAVSNDTIMQPALFEYKHLMRHNEEEIKSILPDVTVVTSNNKTLISRDDVSVRFGYKDSIFSITEKDFKDYDDLENFLHARMPGSYINVETGGIYFIGDKGAQIRPRIFVDNREDVFDRLDYYHLPMNVISKVVVQHMVSAITQRPVYFIHLTVKESVNAIASPELISTEINGYYEARAFYLPPIRKNFTEINTYSTLFWKPDIVLKAKDQWSVPIHNTGKSSYRIIVQGLTHSGTPFYATAGFEVK